jgi:hypothetical protein
MEEKVKKKTVCLKITLKSPTNKEVDLLNYIRLALLREMIPVINVEEV